MNPFKLFIATLVAVALQGCAALGAQGMTPKQIEALGKNDAATVFCNSTEVAAIKTTTTYARVDDTVRQNVKVDEKCAIEMKYVPIEEAE